MKKLSAIVVVLIVILVIGCSGSESIRDNGSTIQEEPQGSMTQQTAGQEEQELVLSFAGDMMFDKSVAGFIKSKGGDYVFQGYEKYLKSSDAVFGNLETALSSGGKPILDKEHTFRSDPQLADFMRKYNFTAMSLANNHSLDYGRPAFVDSMRHLKDKGICYGGGGHNKKEAIDGVVFKRKGLDIGFIAFTGVVPSVDWYATEKRPGIIGAYKVHEAEVLSAVSSLDSRCDILVVSVHWGKEGSTAVRKQEAELAHKLVDAGADVVMGHHPHVVQSFELYKDKLIMYSLGNFIFTTSYAEISNRTILATARFDGSGKLKAVEAVPGIIKYGRPSPMDEIQSRAYLDDLNKVNINIKL